MIGLFSQLRLDARIAWKGGFVAVTLGMALFLGLMLRFAVPEQLDVAAEQTVHDGTANGLFGGASGQVDGARLMPSADAVREAVREEGQGVGVLLRGTVEQPAVTFVIQGHESEEARHLMAAVAAQGWIDRGSRGGGAYSVTRLGPASPPPPFNGSWLPMLFGLDTVVLGFFFASVMVLQEKMHGTVRFYRVTPGGTARYLLSKTLVNTLMALVGAAVMTACVAPRGLLDPWLFLVLGLATGALTLLGIGLSVFFDNLSSFFYPLAAVALLLSAPMVAYALPQTAVPGLALIPTHAVMFTSRELLFPAGRGDLLAATLAQLTLGLLLCGIFAAIAVDRRLMREAL